MEPVTAVLVYEKSSFQVGLKNFRNTSHRLRYCPEGILSEWMVPAPLWVVNKVPVSCREIGAFTWAVTKARYPGVSVVLQTDRYHLALARCRPQ